jgi:hypothetical protein
VPARGYRQARFWAAVYAAGEERVANHRVRLPQLTGLQEFAVRHPLAGSIAQGLLFGVAMGAFLLVLGLPLVLVGEADGWVGTTLRLAVLSGVLFAIGMGAFNRYQHRYPGWRPDRR